MVIALVVLFVIIVLWSKNASKWARVISAFNRGNVIVFGRKGTGKDLLFQAVINSRKKKYFSNVDYGGKGVILPIDELNVDPNTYEQFINGTVIKSVKKDEREKVDYYLSDAGVYLPSQYNALLDKKYKSLPIYYALSRHLYNSNIHVNTQALGRVWNKLREQADTYIQTIHTVNLGFMLVTKYRMYEKYETAQAEIRAFKAGGWISSKEIKAKQEEFRLRYGEIIEGYKVQIKGRIKYDTRHFEKVLFTQEGV